MAKRNRKASLRIADEAEQLHRATRDWTKLTDSPEGILLTVVLRFLDDLDERVQKLEHAERLRAEVARIDDLTEEVWPAAREAKRPRRTLLVPIAGGPPPGASVDWRPGMMPQGRKQDG